MAQVSTDLRTKQIDALLQQYPSFASDKSDASGSVTLYGPFLLDANGPSGEVCKAFELEIKIPADYPEKLPTTREVRAGIRQDFEHTYPDGSFCLAAPMQERMEFNKTQTLRGYFDNLVIPFLYGYTIWERTGSMPFDELGHGLVGVFEWYEGQLTAKDRRFMAKQLFILCKQGYNGEILCACGSGKKAKKCHHQLLKKLAKADYRYQLVTDTYLMAQHTELLKPPGFALRSQ